MEDVCFLLFHDYDDDDDDNKMRITMMMMMILMMMMIMMTKMTIDPPPSRPAPWGRLYSHTPGTWEQRPTAFSCLQDGQGDCSDIIDLFTQTKTVKPFF